jgi:hypothetical protein
MRIVVVIFLMIAGSISGLVHTLTTMDIIDEVNRTRAANDQLSIVESWPWKKMVAVSQYRATHRESALAKRWKWSLLTAFGALIAAGLCLFLRW